MVIHQVPFKHIQTPYPHDIPMMSRCNLAHGSGSRKRHRGQDRECKRLVQGLDIWEGRTARGPRGLRSMR